MEAFRQAVPVGEVDGPVIRGGEGALEIVDAQVHAWEADGTGYTWDPSRPKREHTRVPFPVEEVKRAMAAAGVNAALLVTPSLYGYDNRYTLDAVAKFPETFAAIGRIDPKDPDLGERLQGWRKQPGVLGVRVTLSNDEALERWRAGGYERLLDAAESSKVPICLYPPGILRDLPEVIERHDGLQIVIDHLGLSAPPVLNPIGDPFAELPALLALAPLLNVSVKLTATPSLSQEAFPYRDVWPYVRRVIDTFGPDRVMWGTDLSRVRPLHSYPEALGYLEEMGLSFRERQLVLGQTLRRVFRWPRREPPKPNQ